MTLYNCDKCNAPIGLNEGYIAITYNVEMMKHDTVTLQDTIHVKHSELVLVLCGKCGNQHQALSIKEAMALKRASLNKIKPEKIEKNVKSSHNSQNTQAN